MPIDEQLIPDILEVGSSKEGDFKNTDRTLPKYIWKMSGKHQLTLCVMAMIATLVNLIPLELQRRIIDNAIEERSLEALINLGIAYAIALLAYQIIKFLFRIYQGWVAESTIRNTRAELIKIHSQNPEIDDEEGQSISVISTEVESIGTYVGEHISDASSNIMMLVGVTVYMFIIEPAIALYALIFFIPQIALVPFMQRLLNRLIKKRVELVRTLNTEILDISSPIKSPPKIIKSIYLNRMRFTILKYTMKALINFLNTLGPLTVLIYGGYLAIEGETTAGVIVAFLSGFQRMSGPIRGLISFYRLTAQTQVQYCMMESWIKKSNKL